MRSGSAGARDADRRRHGSAGGGCWRGRGLGGGGGVDWSCKGDELGSKKIGLKL